MSFDRKKVAAELVERRDRINAAIAQLNAGIEWQTPEQRAEFELNAKRQWLCEQIGLSPGNSWADIVKVFKDLDQRLNVVRATADMEVEP